ncbi:MAG: hypothetical protein KDD55_00075 [Bdellovibrionales bacterium]|nr:hypothetical protein [Bdellovibrionales bacterium]
MGTTSTPWITVPGSDSNEDLERTLASRVEAHIAQGDFTQENIRYVEKLRLDACRGTLHVSDEILERLRMLCQLWSIELRPRTITSHRRYIGPVIVAFKKALYPLISFFLKDLIRQQKDFNAATIRLVTELANSQESKDS